MPLPDNRRINGPSQTFQIASFLTPRDPKLLTSAAIDKSSSEGIVNNKGLRKDSRRPDEIRPIYLKAGKCDSIQIYFRKRKERLRVRGLMAIDVECEFRDRGSIPSVCQITDVDLGQVG